MRTKVELMKVRSEFIEHGPRKSGGHDGMIRRARCVRLLSWERLFAILVSGFTNNSHGGFLALNLWDLTGACLVWMIVTLGFAKCLLRT